MSIKNSLQAVVIKSGDTESAAVDARNYNAFSLIKPATTGDAISFEVATNAGGPWTALLSTGTTPVSLTTATTAGTYPVPASVAAFPWFRLVSDTTEGADRTITVVKAQV